MTHTYATIAPDGTPSPADPTAKIHKYALDQYSMLQKEYRAWTKRYPEAVLPGTRARFCDSKDFGEILRRCELICAEIERIKLHDRMMVSYH
jgi:hypothetical protein